MTLMMGRLSLSLSVLCLSLLCLCSGFHQATAFGTRRYTSTTATRVARVQSVGTTNAMTRAAMGTGTGPGAGAGAGVVDKEDANKDKMEKKVEVVLRRYVFD